MAALLWLAANVVMVIFIVKTAKEKDQVKKKKDRMVWLISLGVASVMFFVVGAQGKKLSEEKGEEIASDENTQSVSTEEAIATVEAKEAETVESEPSEPVQSTEVIETAIEDSVEQEELFSVEIVAGETGEFGRELVLNAGTDFEDKTIGYFVPIGLYEVTNLGDKPTQVNVYKNEKNVVDGWEEWANGHVELLKPNETKEMNVEDGYFFNVDVPSHISVKWIGNADVSVLSEEKDEAYVVKKAVEGYIDANYKGTSIEKIEINPDYGTEDENDYIALIYLIWDVQNSGETSKTILDMYSQDMAVRMYEDLPEIQELAVFWTVPYLNNGSAKISFERTNGGMSITDIVFDKNFN